MLNIFSFGKIGMERQLKTKILNLELQKNLALFLIMALMYTHERDKEMQAINLLMNSTASSIESLFENHYCTEEEGEEEPE